MNTDRHIVQAEESTEYNVVSYLQRHAHDLAQRTALRWVEFDEIAAFAGDVDAEFTTHDISYADFYTTICRVATGLSELGIGKGDRVILFLPMGLAMYSAMFAIQHIGAIAVFLDSWARRSHLGACADCVKPKAMISHKMAFDLVSSIPEFGQMPLRIISGPRGECGGFSAQLEHLFLTEEEAPMVPVGREDTALITFTTGSSGVPKGANRTHRFLRAQHEALNKVIAYTPVDTDIPAFPIFSLNNLASGVVSVLPAIGLAQPRPTDSAALVNQILHDGISCTTLSPSMLNNLSAYCIEHRIELTPLRRVITGGAPISKDNVRAFKLIAPATEIWILYGSTEVEPMAHIEAEEMLSLEENPDPEIVENGVNVGKIAEGLRYKFITPGVGDVDFDTLDWRNLEMSTGDVGEFIVTGEHVCKNYYNNAEAFYKTKIREQDGTVWHRTGDLGRMDEQGYLWVVGRVHNMVNRQGRFYFPVSAEIILKRCDFVKKGAFLGLPDEQLGERTVVAVEFTDGYGETTAAVKEVRRLFAKNNIVVDGVYQVQVIPMDPRHHSKVEYAVLRDLILSGKARELSCQQT